MKKISTPTVVALIACAASVSSVTPVLAQTFPNLPITSEQRATADQVAQAGVPLSELSPNAPDSYTVKRGDTLWGISGLYLLRPWRWPELWGMNRDQIANPHLIYPGQVLYLDKSNGRARLRVGQPVGNGAGGDTVKLTPQVRIESSGGLPIPAIPASAIEPFLSQPLIVDEAGLASAPRVVATQESRLFTGKGDKIYTRGMPADNATKTWQVFRPARPLLDPDTRQVVAYEAMYLGEAQTTRAGDPTTMVITTSKE
ncbi:MAG TPA: LysM domain-containing protein, partial [Burkholderiaceae bacterium]|nr:LysM domain-containing protein [Burkholderiaceae bacterium]